MIQMMGMRKLLILGMEIKLVELEKRWWYAWSLDLLLIVIAPEYFET